MRSSGLEAQATVGGSVPIVRARAGPNPKSKTLISPRQRILLGQFQYAPLNDLIAIGRDDDANDPDAKTHLRAAAERAAAKIEVEVYDGDHGWTVLDSPVYAESEAERAWAALLQMYSEAL